MSSVFASRYSDDKIIPIVCLANPLCAQYSALKMMNDSMPAELRVDDSWFEADDVKHVEIKNEDIGNFDFYFVAKETLELTFKYNFELMKLKHGRSFHYPEWLVSNISDVRIDNVGYNYAPGIHIIRTNLLNGWNGEDTNYDAPFFRRIAARDGGKKLIGVELLSSFAMQPMIFWKNFDGVLYPKYCMAGINVKDNDVLGLGYNSITKCFEMTYLNEFRSDHGRIPLELIQ